MTSSHTPRIVVGVDGSAPSQQAPRWAAQLAAMSGAHLEAVAAWAYPTMYGRAPGPERSPAADADKLLTGTVDAVFGASRPADMRLVVQEGYPAKVLLDAADGALMLIVGSRGHGGFAGMLLGSVSASVAEHATCPVLVVHGDQTPPAMAL